MSHELHYTSAARGLKSGSVGYCTVGATANLPSPLAVRLEGLSAYRAVYPHGHALADRNPWVISHAKLSIAGMTYNVISRVSDAGLDYSERDNTYAHHVAIESHERPEAGPAWLASRANFLEKRWSREPGIVESRRVPKDDWAPRICAKWAEWFGDEGWAGAVAESFLADPNRPVHIVFEPGDDILPLFVEALALLPRDRRWDVGFSTYYTGQSQGLACPWRGVLRGSPEEQQARRLPNAIVLDPRHPPGRAEGGALVDQARTGIAPPERDRSIPAAYTPSRTTNPVRVGPKVEPYPIREEETQAPVRPRASRISASPPAQKPANRSSRTAEGELRQKILFAGVGLGVTVALGCLIAAAAWFSLPTKAAPTATGVDPGLAVVDQIEEKISGDYLDEARTIANEVKSDPRFANQPRFAEILGKLAEAEKHADDFQNAINRLAQANLDEETPAEWIKANELARGPKNRREVDGMMADRKVRRSRRAQVLATSFRSELETGDLEKAGETLAQLEKIHKIVSDPPPINEMKEKLAQERERVTRFARAMNRARRDLRLLTAGRWWPSSAQPSPFFIAQWTARTPEERKQVEALRNEFLSASGPKVPPIPSRPADSMEREVGKDAPSPSPRASAARSQAGSDPSILVRNGLFLSMEDGKTPWTPVVGKVVKSVRILGLRDEERGRAKIKLEGHVDGGKGTMTVTSEINSGIDNSTAPVLLGTFSADFDKLRFDKPATLEGRASEAFKVLESCALEAELEDGRLVRCLLKPFPLPDRLSIDLGNLFNREGLRTTNMEKNSNGEHPLVLSERLWPDDWPTPPQPFLDEAGLYLVTADTRPIPLTRSNLDGPPRFRKAVQIGSEKTPKTEIQLGLKNNRLNVLIYLNSTIYKSIGKDRLDNLMRKRNRSEAIQEVDRIVERTLESLNIPSQKSKPSSTNFLGESDKDLFDPKFKDPQKKLESDREAVQCFGSYLRFLYSSTIEISLGVKFDGETFYLLKADPGR